MTKESNLSFIDGFDGARAREAIQKGNKMKSFDWDKAAKIIKSHLSKHPDLTAEAGLQGDWDYTGGVIFEDGKPTNDSYTYLSSVWAAPTLIISWSGKQQIEKECSSDSSRFSSDSKWDELSLKILGLSL